MEIPGLFWAVVLLVAAAVIVGWRKNGRDG